MPCVLRTLCSPAACRSSLDPDLRVPDPEPWTLIPRPLGGRRTRQPSTRSMPERWKCCVAYTDSVRSSVFRMWSCVSIRRMDTSSCAPGSLAAAELDVVGAGHARLRLLPGGGGGWSLSCFRPLIAQSCQGMGSGRPAAAEACVVVAACLEPGEEGDHVLHHHVVQLSRKLSARRAAAALQPAGAHKECCCSAGEHAG